MKSLFAFVFLALFLVSCGDDEIVSNPTQPPTPVITRTLVANEVMPSDSVKEILEQKGLDLSKNCFQVIDKKEGDSSTRLLEMSPGKCPEKEAASDQVKLSLSVVPQEGVAKLQHEQRDVGSLLLPTDKEKSFIILELFSDEFAKTNRLDIEHDAGMIKSVAIRLHSSEEDALKSDIQIAKQKADAELAEASKQETTAKEALDAGKEAEASAKETLEKALAAAADRKTKAETRVDALKDAEAARVAHDQAIQKMKDLEKAVGRAQEKRRIVESSGKKMVADVEAKANAEQQAGQAQRDLAESIKTAKTAELVDAERIAAETQTAFEDIKAKAEQAVGDAKQRAMEDLEAARKEADTAKEELAKLKAEVEQAEKAVEEKSKDVAAR